MKRGAVIAVGSVLAAGVAASVAMAFYGSVGDGLLVAAIVLPLGALALTAAWVLVKTRRRVGSLRRQLLVAIAIAVLTAVIAYALFVPAMFVSAHDAVMAVLVAGFSAVVAFAVGALLGGGVLSDITRLRDGLQSVGEGERAISLPTDGTDELAELARAASVMVERLASEERAREAVETARRDLVAAVSHDLRTPITALALITEAIEDKVVDPETRQVYLKRLSTHVRTLAALVDDLFELTRIESGDIRWSMEQIALGPLLDTTVDAMRVHAERCGVRVEAEVPSGLPPARANPEQVQRVLNNLIQNAIRHTPADGAVTVRASSIADLVEIEVADTGEGIAAEERERVFDAFFQGGPRGRARSDDDGAGLGLAIARAIVEAHGGRIWIEPRSEGTTVRFSLPLAA